MKHKTCCFKLWRVELCPFLPLQKGKKNSDTQYLYFFISSKGEADSIKDLDLQTEAQGIFWSK